MEIVLHEIGHSFGLLADESQRSTAAKLRPDRTVERERDHRHDARVNQVERVDRSIDAAADDNVDGRDAWALRWRKILR